MSDQTTPLEPKKKSKALLIGGIVVVLAAAVAVAVWMAKPKPTTTSLPGKAIAPGGTYADLTAAQRRFVDDWSERFGKAMGRKVEPAQVYADLPLSTKTTFNAVTHALSHTILSDRTGQPMGMSALDLIAGVDTVAGKVPGKGGDKQFRMYVELKPGTRETLEQCREFSRQVDNTVFHKGYPTCFRGSGGTPSIQFSLSRDGKRGDVDVDYRSRSFPVMLVNGHLTASNSDVRAGDNDQRHNQHWSGLRNWWRGFMGLPFFESTEVQAGGLGAPVAKEPRLGKEARPEEAIRDFLNTWLVEQNPGTAIGYISSRAFACMEVERGIPVDRGVARFQMYRAMRSFNQISGKAASLGEVVNGVSLKGPRGTVVKQPYDAQFVMYDVREDLAEQSDCENKLHPEQLDPKRASSTDFGKYVGAVFQLKTPAVKSEIVATIWAKEQTGWTLVSYDVEPEIRPGAFVIPSIPQAPSAEPALAVVEGAPSLKRAVAAFHEAWFQKKDVSAAFRYLSRSCYSCFNVFRPENLPAASSELEAGKILLDRMRAVADWVPAGKRLEDVLVAAEPHHQDLKLIRHGQEQAFSLVSVPDSMGLASKCANLKPGGAVPLDRPGALSYGRFFAAGARLKRAGPDAAVLWTVWSREGREWKIGSYLLLTP